MKAAYLADAKPPAVSHAVRRVLEARHALVTEHVSSRIRFLYRIPGTTWAWSRKGYVGIYQHLGEKDAELRFVLRARWPHRIFWGVAVADVLVAILTYALNPPATTWFVLAFVTGIALLLAFLLYVNTWRDTRALETSFMEAFVAALREEEAVASLEREDAHEARRLEAELEAEVERRRIAKSPPPAGKTEKRKLALPRFGKRPPST